MILWAICNTAFSIIAIVLLTYKLAFQSADTSCPERIGLGLIASGLTLNIGPILAQVHTSYGDGFPTPFDNWASMMIRVGAICYFWVRIARWRTSYQTRKNGD
jgi:hypothetical protein